MFEWLTNWWSKPLSEQMELPRDTPTARLMCKWADEGRFSKSLCGDLMIGGDMEIAKEEWHEMILETSREILKKIEAEEELNLLEGRAT